MALKLPQKKQHDVKQDLSCRFCGGLVGPAVAVRCSKCTTTYHHACAEKIPKSVNEEFVICCQPTLDPKTVNQETIVLLSTMNSLAAQFGTMRSDIQDVKTSVHSMGARLDRQGKEIESLKNRSDITDKAIKDLSAKVDNLPTADMITQLTMRELDDITNRRSNVIVFNMTDDQSADSNTLKELDGVSIDNLIASLDLNDKVILQSHFRIGKKVPSSTSNRPLKLRFVSQDQAQLFISTFWQNKKKSPTSPILTLLSVSPDRTPTQLRMYQDCGRHSYQRAWRINRTTK